ncbi:MAG: hypothetical protein IPK62_07425 [Bacteroidetes bacterium]|nr:hypothetical protein [Bacteroidota bacterium]
MKRLLVFLISLCSLQVAIAQPYSAYTDIRLQFYVFDNAAANQVEHLLPIDYKIGKNAVAYLDNQRIFKIYKDGQSSVVNDMFTTNFHVSDNLILFKSANMLSVVDDGKVVLLSKLCNRYAMGDSVVLFYDANRSSFNGYYNGKTTELETFLNLRDNDFTFDSTVKVSDNIGAYINYNEQFKVFYNGESEVLENQTVKQFQVGRDIVAYVDINNIFKIYYKGQSFTIDPFPPKSFMVGDDVVAFHGNDGYFKIFYRGNLITVGYYEPRYHVADRVVSFADPNGFFKVFYEGEQTVIDNYYPEKIKAGYNSLVYTNKANMVRMFSKGQMYDITTMTLLDLRLDYDVLQYKVGFNAFKIFYEGNHYN